VIRSLGLQHLPGDSEPSIHIPTSAVAYEAALSGLTALNVQLLGLLAYPSIYDAGVVYHKEPRDVWRHVVDVYRSGWGDCEDLAAWRAAELQASGEDPDAFVYVYRSAAKRYHAVVGRGDGTVEDPSYILGMRVPPGWRPIEQVGDTRYLEGDEE
jgi:hypothetical protein